MVIRVAYVKGCPGASHPAYCPLTSLPLLCTINFHFCKSKIHHRIEEWNLKIHFGHLSCTDFFLDIPAECDMMEAGKQQGKGKRKMLHSLQEEMNLVFDFNRSGIAAESSQRAPDQKDVAKLDFMVFTADPPRRFLSRSVKYAAADEEPVFYSVLPFDGPYHRHNA